MAQLSDDCFAQDRALLPVDEAARLIEANVTPVKETETVALKDALGRVAALDVVAPIALPSFENSAVDGFAVRHSDVGATEETRLRIVERIFAGDEPARALGAGEAARIFTGAPMPKGADTVYMQEDSRIDGDHVIVPAGLKLGANRRAVGEDVRAGAI